MVDYKEIQGKEGITVQGDVRAGFDDFCNKDLASFAIDISLISYEDGGNKKTAKH